MSDDLVKRLRGWARDIQEGSTATWAMDQDLKEAASRIEELKAKLAKAVDALYEAIYLLDPDDEDIAKETGLHRIVTTLAELKGETDA